MTTPTILSTELKTYGRQTYAVFTVPSSNGKSEYRVDMTNGRCSCPGWKFQRQNAEGKRSPCKHLRQFGYTENTQVVKPAPSKPAKVMPSYEVML